MSTYNQVDTYEGEQESHYRGRWSWGTGAMAVVVMIRKPNGSWSKPVYNRALSVARMALEHGINANLLRKWIDRYREQVTSDAEHSVNVTGFCAGSVTGGSAAGGAIPQCGFAQWG